MKLAVCVYIRYSDVSCSFQFASPFLPSSFPTPYPGNIRFQNFCKAYFFLRTIAIIN